MAELALLIGSLASRCRFRCPNLTTASHLMPQHVAYRILSSRSCTPQVNSRFPPGLHDIRKKRQRLGVQRWHLWGCICNGPLTTWT